MTGIGLDENFDFFVNDAGDIGIEDGTTDIEKDLSVITADVLSDRADGEVIDDTTRLRLESLVTTALLGHELVEQVADVSIQRGRNDNIRSTIRVIVDGEAIETTV
jgi:hypothetical protein